MSKAMLGLTLGVFACAALWAIARFEYPARSHTGGSRLYRINSYEQFIRKNTGGSPIILGA